MTFDQPFMTIRRQKTCDPRKISKGEHKLVREVVADRGRVQVDSARNLPHDGKGSSDKAGKIASSDSLIIGAELSEGWGVFRLQKLGLRR
jgi:hypothetical protein